MRVNPSRLIEDTDTIAIEVVCDPSKTDIDDSVEGGASEQSTRCDFVEAR